MKADETATFVMIGQQKEAGNASRGSFYFDPSLLQRENFLRYLASIILH